MTPLVDLLQQGPAHAWLFIPSAILLGALHGLEPGHSKTMMAAFIIAIRGTVLQAVLLGLAATVSHTLVVWLVALAGLHFGQQWSAETSEPYFQILSAVLICAIAVWMLARTRQAQLQARLHSHHHERHGHDEDHDRHEHDEPHGHHDAHALAHADEIRRRVGGGSVTTRQIVMIGLTGGLIPCPAAITVLLLCLQLRQFSLGIVLVLCFSIGLAITLVSAGVIAALSVRHVSRRWSGFDAFARRAPYASGAVIICVGIYIGVQGVLALQGS
jgi:nickel/cobalt exporter